MTGRISHLLASGVLGLSITALSLSLAAGVDPHPGRHLSVLQHLRAIPHRAAAHPVARHAVSVVAEPIVGTLSAPHTIFRCTVRRVVARPTGADSAVHEAIDTSAASDGHDTVARPRTISTCVSVTECVARGVHNHHDYLFRILGCQTIRARRQTVSHRYNWRAGPQVSIHSSPSSPAAAASAPSTIDVDGSQVARSAAQTAVARLRGARQPRGPPATA